MEPKVYEMLTKVLIVSTLVIMVCLFTLDGLSAGETTMRMAVIIGLILLVRWIEKGKRKSLEKENQRLRLELKGWVMTAH